MLNRPFALSAFLMPVVAMTAVAGAVRPAIAAPPVLAVLKRPISPAPEGTDSVLVRLYGDKSGAVVQVRLLAPAQDGILSGSFASAPIVVDFEGWKTVSLPLSQFTFTSDTNPDARQDGLSSVGSLQSSTSVQLAVLASNSRLAVNTLSWAKGDTPSGAMETFENASLRQWQPIGDHEQTRAISFGGVASGPLSENGRPSLQMIVRNPALSDRLQHKPAVDARLKRTPATPYVLFVRAPFDPIYPDTVPTDRDLTAPLAVNITASADESEPGTFAIYSIKELQDVTVKVAGALVAPGRSPLPASAVNIHVVRTGNGYPAPQVLMKDDRQSLAGPLPSVRLTGDPQTTIPAETTKQFWVTVRVPKATAAGTYAGRLMISGAGMGTAYLPFTVTVPDINLKTAFLQYGIELRNRVANASDSGSSEAVPQETFGKQLSDIREHGFKLVQTYQTVGGLENDIRLYKEAGLSLVGPVVVALQSGSEATQVEGIKRTLGLPPNFDIYYYLSPEIASSGGAGSFAQGIIAANRSALIAALVETSTVYGGLREALNDMSGEKLAPIYPISSDYAQKVIAQGKRSTPNRDYWRWSIPDQSAIRNRLLAGFLLYKTGPGFYGAFPGPYQRIPQGMTPYAVFEGGEGTLFTAANRPAMTTFPVDGGVLDTIQWEAAREGVDDIRYIGALKAIVRELKDAKKAKAETDAAEAMLATLMNRPLLSLSPADHQTTRLQIIDAAVKLRYILEPGRRPATVRGAKPAATPAAKPKKAAKPKRGKS